MTLLPFLWGYDGKKVENRWPLLSSEAELLLLLRGGLSKRQREARGALGPVYHDCLRVWIRARYGADKQ